MPQSLFCPALNSASFWQFQHRKADSIRLSRLHNLNDQAHIRLREKVCVWNAPLIEATRASLSRCRFPPHVELCLSQLNLHTLHHAGISYVVLLFESRPCFLLVGLFVEQNCTVKCTWQSLEAAHVSVCTHHVHILLYAFISSPSTTNTHSYKPLFVWWGLTSCIGV